MAYFLLYFAFSVVIIFFLVFFFLKVINPEENELLHTFSKKQRQAHYITLMGAILNSLYIIGAALIIMFLLLNPVIFKLYEQGELFHFLIDLLMLDLAFMVLVASIGINGVGMILFFLFLRPSFYTRGSSRFFVITVGWSIISFWTMLPLGYMVVETLLFIFRGFDDQDALANLQFSTSFGQGVRMFLAVSGPILILIGGVYYQIGAVWDKIKGKKAS